MSDLPAHFYFDPDGNPISFERWATMLNDFDVRLLADSRIPGGRSIRTCWHGFVDPLAGANLYGTAVVHDGGNVSELGMWGDRAAALAAHGYFVGALGLCYFCPVCRRTSTNIEDLKYGWCGHCRASTGPEWQERRDPRGG